MHMSPALRRFGLTAHVVSSAGWGGAVAGFLALAIAGLTSADPQIVRGAYLSMNVIAWYVIVPLAFGTLITGIVQSVFTSWGLFRQRWIAVKLGLTLVATTVLLIKLPMIGAAAAIATANAVSVVDLMTRTQLIVHAAGGLIVLCAATAIAIYKPWGPLRA